MPRGHLKHKDRHVGAKQARGGSSRRNSFGGYWSWDEKRSSKKHAGEELEDICEGSDYDFHYENEYDCADTGYDCETLNRSRTALTIGDFLGESDRTKETTAGCQQYDSCSVQSSYCNESSFSFCEQSVQNEAESFCLVEDEADNDVFSFCTFDDSCCEGQSLEMKPSAVMFHYADVDEECMLSVCHKCPICMEQKEPYETLQLFHGCRHPSACKECLHSHYIKHAMNDISNFPLKCFWPTCGRYLRDVQLHGFAKHADEIQAFHSMEASAKQAKKAARECEKHNQSYELLQQRRDQNLQVLQHCRRCHHATPVFPGREGTQFQCYQCKVVAKIDVMTPADTKAMIRADIDEKTKKEEHFVHARTLGDLLVNCPFCSTLIYKDGGCFELRCEVCLRQFDFKAAKVKMDCSISNSTPYSRKFATWNSR